MIIFVRFNGFYIACLRAQDRSLSDAPLAVFKDGQVLDASAEAARWGVCSGNSKSLACRRCPGLVCEEFNPDWCRELFSRAWSVFAEITPLIEPVDFHEGFLDLSGCVPRRMTLEDFFQATLWKLRFKTGLDATWGGGQDKWFARLACGHNTCIAPDDETRVLNRVPLARLDLDPDLCERLSRYGILSVGALLSTPRSFLQSHLQLTSKDLLPLLRRDSSSVRLLFPPPVLKMEAGLLWGDDEEIRQAILMLSERATHELRECHQQCGQIRLLLFLRSGEQIRCRKFSKPVFKQNIIETTLHREILEEHPRDLRRITVILEHLSPAVHPQGELWQNTFQKTDRSERIETACQALERRHGHQTVQTGRDYASRVPPRFAQLIYSQRGIYLP